MATNSRTVAPEPYAKHRWTPDAVKDVLTRCAFLGTENPVTGTSPIQDMTHEQRVALAAKLDDLRDRFSKPEHPEYTRLTVWSKNRKGLVDTLYKAINVTRMYISKVDVEIAPRPRAEDISRADATSVLALSQQDL